MNRPTSIGPHSTGSLPRRQRRDGFTLIEMMVVIAILLLTFGLILPSLTEFLKNRELDAATAQITSSFQTARMQSVVNGRPFRVVFFREGVRIYDEELMRWSDEEFDPRTAPAADPSVSFDLRFADKESDNLPAYREWAERLGIAEDNVDPETGERFPINLEGLITVAFQRDGTLRVSGGNDVPSGGFREEPPKDADIVVWQLDNDYSGFIDLQATGSVKSKVAQNTKVKRLSVERDGGGG